MEWAACRLLAPVTVAAFDHNPFKRDSCVDFRDNATHLRPSGLTGVLRCIFLATGFWLLSDALIAECAVFFRFIFNCFLPSGCCVRAIMYPAGLDDLELA